MLKRFVLVFYLIFVSISSVSADQMRDIRLAVREAMLQSGGVGCSVTVAHRGSIVFQHGFGLADVEHSVAVRPQTVFRIASVSKPITGIAVMQLVQQGKLDIDEDVRTFVPEFPDKGDILTLRQILSHTSGIRGYKPGEWDSKEQYASVSESLEMFKDDPLVQPPGEKYLYSTHAYTLAARAVETASGLSFPDYLRQNIFQPSGMTSTGPEELRPIVRDRARGYVRDQDGNLLNSIYTDISYKWAGGGLVSTSGDLCRMGIALLEGKLLNDQARDTLWQRQSTSDGSLLGYALGWSMGEINNRKTAGHGGAQPAARASFVIYPDDELVIAVLANSENENPSAISNKIADIWFGTSQ